MVRHEPFEGVEDCTATDYTTSQQLMLLDMNRVLLGCLASQALRGVGIVVLCAVVDQLVRPDESLGAAAVRA
jgi:hypothetical protein